MKREIMRKFTALFSILVTILPTLLLCGCANTYGGLELNTDFTEPKHLSDGGGRRVRVVLLLGQSNATGVALNIYFSTADEGLTTLNEPIGEPDVAHYDAMSELKLGHLFGRHIIKFYEEIN